jgi:hypothetical protein
MRTSIRSACPRGAPKTSLGRVICNGGPARRESLDRVMSPDLHGINLGPARRVQRSH